METIIRLVAMLFIPTFLAFLTYPLCFWKRLHNTFILSLGYLLAALPFIVLWQQFGSGWAKLGAVICMVLVAIPNVWGLKFYRNRVKKNRCPECHCMDMKVVGADEEITGTIKKTKWSDGSTTTEDNTTTIYHYDMYCPQCGYEYHYES